MNKAKTEAFLEGTLSCFTTRDRAMSILGDLLEGTDSKSRLEFWISFVRILFALMWRGSVTWLLPYAIGGLIFASLVNADPLWNEIGFKGVDPVGLIATVATMIVFPSAVALWFLAPYSVYRFGLSDRFTWIALPSFAATTLGVLFPEFTPVCALMIIAAILLSLFSGSWRWASIAFCITVGAGAASLTGTISVVHELVARYPPLGYHLHWLIVRIACLLSFGVLTTAYSWMHSIQSRRTQESRLSQVR